VWRLKLSKEEGVDASASRRALVHRLLLAIGDNLDNWGQFAVKKMKMPPLTYSTTACTFAQSDGDESLE
jgi:hypothetical protein